MTYTLKDHRDSSFEIESDTLKPIIEYLGYPVDYDEYDVQQKLQEDNEGMAFYYLEVEGE